MTRPAFSFALGRNVPASLFEEESKPRSQAVFNDEVLLDSPRDAYSDIEAVKAVVASGRSLVIAFGLLGPSGLQKPSPH